MCDAVLLCRVTCQFVVANVFYVKPYCFNSRVNQFSECIQKITTKHWNSYLQITMYEIAIRNYEIRTAYIIMNFSVVIAS